MSLPKQPELQSLFSSFLVEAGLSSVSIKNYLSDLRHFLNFCEIHSSVISLNSVPASIEEIFQNPNRFLTPYLEDQQATYTPKSTTNRRMASIRRFASFLSVKFEVHPVFTQQTITNQNIRTGVFDHVPAFSESNQSASLSPFFPSTSPIIPTTTNIHQINTTPVLSSARILEQFKGSLEREKKTHSTIKNYLSDLNHFFLWTANQTPFTTQNLLNILSESQLQAYITYLRLSHTGTSVLNRRQSSIKKLARFCHSEGYIPENPFELKSIPQKLAPLAWIERLAHKPKKPPNGPKNLPAGWHGRFVLLYDRYNSLRWTPYLNIAILVLATTAMAIFAYNQIIEQARPSAAATALTPPKRQLSFQGRLTDSGGTPITTATSITFKLYNALTGPTELYTTGTCSVTPDTAGIFNTLIGDTVCGAEITSSVFTDNRDIYLEVIVGTGGSAQTLTPRQQIATVGYAINSYTLQGYPASASAVENTIPVMNNDGDIILGSDSPDFKSTSGTFTIEGQSIAIKTTPSSGGSIVLQPDAIGGIGNVQVITADATGNQFRVEDVNLTSGNLISGYVGNSTATGRLLSLSSDYGSSNLDKFYVAVDGRTKINATSAAGWPALTVNQTSTGDLISASVSGTTKFTVTNSGNVDITGQYLINGIPFGNSNWQRVSGNLSPAVLNDTVSATTSAATALTITQTGAFNALLVQDSAGDTTPFTIDQSGNVSVGGNLLASADNTQDIGDATNRWSRLYLYTGINDKDGTEVISTLSKRLTGGAAWNVVTGLRIGDTAAITAGYEFDLVGDAQISGNITSAGNSTLGTGASSVNTIGSTTTPGTLTLHGATTLDNTFTVSGNNLTSLGGDLTVTGALTANSNTQLGNDATDTIDFQARVLADSDLIPIGTTGTNDLGSSALPWDNLYLSGDIVTTATTGTQGWWKRLAGNLSPINSNDTVSATTSAATAMTITQTGAFNAFLVQDVAGDTTPFVIDQSGNVQVGGTFDANAGTFAGTLTANGAVNLGDGGDAIQISGSSIVLDIAGTDELTLSATALYPTASNGSALGTSTNMWSDLFLASGGIINFDNGDYTITHSAGLLTYSGEKMTFNTSATAGIIHLIDSSATTLTAAIYGLDINLTSITDDGGFNANGILLYGPNDDTPTGTYTAINIVQNASSNWHTDISLQNGETIDNDTNGTIAITAATTSTSGNLTVAGTTGLTLFGDWGRDCFCQFRDYR
ncbi:MAG: hypothetical protein UW42_C0023G0001 [Candidatus Collierbacteria bacterium GW2011_GWB1_44_197]|nr:MAG: hypothetical protein UW42_C0023G0001 [Candidatus Collierbacteria bacterium GW2011_GWB1_44_197]